MVTSCKKGVIEDKQVKQLETHLISERKSSKVIGVNHLLNLHTTLIHVVCFSHTGPLHDFKKFQSIIDKYTNATVKKGGPLGNMTLKKKGGNWVKGNDKKGVIQDLRKVKKGVIEFKIGQQSKRGGHRGNGSLKMGAY